MRRALAILACARLAAAAAPARADADEASVALEGLGGLAKLADPAAGEQSTWVRSIDLGVRGSYATSNYFEYQLFAGYAQTGRGQFSGLVDVPTDGGPQDGTLSRKARLLRVGAGIEARLGVRFVPTIGLSVGYQRRTLTAGFIETTSGSLLGHVTDAAYNDLLVAGSLGLDYRINRRWIVGLAAGVSHALPLGGGPAFDSFESGVRVCYYWYPRWATFD